MKKELIEELKKLVVDWNKLGDKYYRIYKREISSDLKTFWLEKSNVHYKCAERLREKLLKHGINV